MLTSFFVACKVLFAYNKTKRKVIIMFFKKELLITQNEQLYFKTMALLRENHVPFKQRITYSSSRYRIKNGPHFPPTTQKPFYYIYVSKKDLETAKLILNSAPRT